MLKPPCYLYETIIRLFINETLITFFKKQTKKFLKRILYFSIISLYFSALESEKRYKKSYHLWLFLETSSKYRTGPVLVLSLNYELWSVCLQVPVVLQYWSENHSGCNSILTSFYRVKTIQKVTCYLGKTFSLQSTWSTQTLCLGWGL